ncbi:MAG: hypothetical protein V3T84_02725 [Phycisphaerales bacterium]
MATLCDILRRIMDRVCGTVETSGIKQMCNGWTGAVNRFTWDSLEPAIDDTTADIGVILSATDPSYTPTDAGDENATYDATGKSTEEMGDDACEIATQAWKDAGCDNGSVDHEDSGTALYKLKDLLPKLYTQAEAA